MQCVIETYQMVLPKLSCDKCHPVYKAKQDKAYYDHNKDVCMKLKSTSKETQHVKY